VSFHLCLPFNLISFSLYIQGVSTNFGNEFYTAKQYIKFIWTWSAKASYSSYSPKSIVKALRSLMHLQEVLKMSYMRFNTCPVTSNTFKDGGGVADIVTAVHIAPLKSLSVVNRGWTNKGFWVFPHVETQMIQVRWAWGPYSGSSSAYQLRQCRSGRLERKFGGASQYFQCCNSKRKRLRTHIHVNFVCCFAVQNSQAKFVHTFQKHSVYIFLILCFFFILLHVVCVKQVQTSKFEHETMKSPNVTVEWLTFLRHIREFPISSFGPLAGYPHWDCCAYPQSLQVTVGTVP
jgi:hypothetical protein